MTNLAEKTCTPCRGGVPPLTAQQAEELRGQSPEWAHAWGDWTSGGAFVRIVVLE